MGLTIYPVGFGDPATESFHAGQIDSAAVIPRVDLYEAFFAGSTDSAFFAPLVPVLRGFFAGSIDSATAVGASAVQGQFLAGSTDSATVGGIISVHGSFFAGSIDSVFAVETIPGNRYDSFFAGSTDSASVTPLVSIGGAFAATSIDSASVAGTNGTDSFSAGSVDSATFNGLASPQGSFFAGSIDSAHVGGGIAGVSYHIYANTGIGDPVNWLMPIGSTSGLSFTPAPLAPSQDWTFAVRAYDAISGLEEKGVGATVRVIIDAAGNDVTGRPAPPTGLRADATGGGGVRVTWGHSGAGKPTGFHVWVVAGTTVNFAATPEATITTGTRGLGAGGALNPFKAFTANVLGLADGVTYAVGVRAFNASGEETNTNQVLVVGAASPPADVVDLVGVAVSRDAR